MADTGATGSLGDLLAARRRRRSVGRAAECDLFIGALTAGGSPIRVLHVHGPAGIGKTSLLQVYGELAVRHGARVLRLDGRDLRPSPPDVLDMLAGVVRFSGDGVASLSDGSRRLALLLDSYERLAPLDDWLRTWLLPRLPASTITVLAGRSAPSTSWLADAAWRELLGVVPLRNLDPEEAGEYLGGSGVDAAVRDRIVAVSHGHPLGLSLLADLAARGSLDEVDPLTPDLVGALLRRFVGTVPGGVQRRALEVCALARVTTETLLREALALDDAHEAFDWLRGLSFVEAGPHGLFPHDLAREALDADLHWRDPQAYRSVFGGIRTHIIGRLKSTTGIEQQRVLLDAKFMHRHQPVSRVWADWNSFGQNYAEPARPADRDVILDLVDKWEGGESAAIARHWWNRQPQGFSVVRHHDGRLHGFLASIDLSRASADDIQADPGAAAAWRHVTARAQRPRDAVTQMRFIIDRDDYQSPSPTMNLAPVMAIQHWLATPHIILGTIALAEPERWDDYFAFFEIHRVADGDFTVGRRRSGLFARDFRQVPLDEWLELMFERDLTGVQAPVPARGPSPALVLSRPDFERAARQALRDLRRRDRLGRNPLTRSRLVPADDAGSADALAALISAAAERLREDPRDEKTFRVIDRTYLRPAPSQERAAELLGLPPSTYKRHLRRGVDRLVSDLWTQELRAAQHDRSEPACT